MTISEKKVYPRTGDYQTVYLKNVVTDSSITIGEYTMYNDFVNDPKEFQKNNVLYHYPLILFHCFLKNGGWIKQM